MKKVLAVIVSLVMVITCCISINAAFVPFENDIMPMWENISIIKNSISFNGTSGTATGYVCGDSGTTSISGTLKVYKQTSSGAWSLVGYDSGTSTSISLLLTANFTAVSGTYYKSVLTTTVYINGVGESETSTSYKTCP